MKIRVLLLTASIVLSCLSVSFAEEKITLSTFYPAPYGDYDELAANKMVVGPTYAVPAGLADLVVEGNVGIGAQDPLGYKLYVNGTLFCTANSYTAGNLITSDERLKTNIYNLETVSDRVMRLRGVQFNWKDSDRNKKDGPQIGLIAQELENEFPELVMEDNEGIKYVRYDNFTAVLLEAIKEQQSQIEALQGEIEEIKKQGIMPQSRKILQK